VFEGEIETLQQRIESERMEIEEIQKSEVRNFEYLNGILRQQADAIRRAIAQKEPQNSEEEQKFESVPNESEGGDADKD
jgi:hypothetical protein